MAGLVGYFLVLRVQAFAAEAFMDICFAGATGASLLGQSPLIGMIAFSLLSALSLGALGERARGRSVEIGMVLSFALGLGVLFLSIYTRSSASHSNAGVSILFGSILSVQPADLYRMLACGSAALLALAVVYRPLLFASIDPTSARARGVPVRSLSVVFLLVLALAYLVLLRAFRSLLLPLMAVLLDAISVAAAYGLLVVIFRFGVGADVLGLYRVSQIEGWVPIFMFAMLFGLSMDYEVFFVTRMRESWDNCGDNSRAVTDGLTHTGRVVSAAALVMVGALSGLVAGHVAGLQELGAGLALGVLLDATIVRGLLMPSLMALLGRWNWWLPVPIARLAGVEASPLAGRERRDLPTSA